MVLIELMQQIKDARVCTSDVIELPILPQFVTVTDLDVSESLVVVMGQCLDEQFFVLDERICPAVVSPVTVTEENEAGGIVKEDNFG
jgi:hypothetical protein